MSPNNERGCSAVRVQRTLSEVRFCRNFHQRNFNLVLYARYGERMRFAPTKNCHYMSHSYDIEHMLERLFSSSTVSAIPISSTEHLQFTITNVPAYPAMSAVYSVDVKSDRMESMVADHQTMAGSTNG
jgi:hypothetical protein